MNAQEIIERIRTAEKKTPVKVYLCIFYDSKIVYTYVANHFFASYSAFL